MMPVQLSAPIQRNHDTFIQHIFHVLRVSEKIRRSQGSVIPVGSSNQKQHLPQKCSDALPCTLFLEGKEKFPAAVPGTGLYP